MIVWTCCDAFGAKPLWAAGPRGGSGDADNGWWTFVGPEGAIELVDYTYTVLVLQLLKARAAYSERLGTYGTRVRKAAELDAFCEGYVWELRKKIEAVVLPEGVTERVEELTTPGRPPTNNGKGSVHALVHGAEEGKKAHFHRPMTATKNAKLQEN